MGSIDNEILLGAEEDAREVAFIQNYIGQEYREQITEDDIYYCLDVMFEEFERLESTADADGYVDIDVEALANTIGKKAKKDGMPAYPHDALVLIAEAELEYNAMLEEE